MNSPVECVRVRVHRRGQDITKLVSMCTNGFWERSVSIVVTVLVDELEMVRMGAREVSMHSLNRTEVAWR